MGKRRYRNIKHNTKMTMYVLIAALRERERRNER